METQRQTCFRRERRVLLTAEGSLVWNFLIALQHADLVYGGNIGRQAPVNAQDASIDYLMKKRSEKNGAHSDRHVMFPQSLLQG